jgi:hypothetical protein
MNDPSVHFDDLQISSNTVAIKASQDGTSLAYLRSTSSQNSSYLLIDTTDSMGLLDFIENLSSQIVIIATSTLPDKTGSFREFFLRQQHSNIAIGDGNMEYSLARLREIEEEDWNVTWYIVNCNT